MQLDRIRSALAEVKTKGHTTVDIDALLAFITVVESESPAATDTRKLQHEAQLATFKAQNDAHLAKYKAERDTANEMFRSVLETAKTALTTSILINGGASVALLTLIGSLLTKAPPSVTVLAAGLMGALVLFALGVLFGGLATGFTYAAQYCYSQRFQRSAVAFHSLTVLMVLATYISFLAGVTVTYHAFL